MEESKKPLFQPWNEEEFQADVFVRGMTWLQRHFYRALLQASFFHSTRPYLPNDDEVLWVLAGAENQELWEQNKTKVLKRFRAVENDSNLLENKRVTADWNNLLEYRFDKSEAGRRRAETAVRIPGGQFGPKVLKASTSPASAGAAGPAEPATDHQEKLREEKLREEKVREVTSATSDVSSLEQSTGSWKQMRMRHKNVFEKKPAKRFEKEYQNACLKYGESVVLECFDNWASGSREWIKRENVTDPLFIFFKKLPEEAEDALELADDLVEDDQRIEKEMKQAADVKKAAEEFQAASIERQTQEIVARRDNRPQIAEVSIDSFMEE